MREGTDTVKWIFLIFAKAFGRWIEGLKGEGSDVEVSDALGMGLYEGFARRYFLSH